jgi:hypothetical protein
MLLNVLSRPHEDGCRALQKLIRHSHETPESKRKLFKKAFELFRSLVDRQIIELNPLRVNVDLQEDFSLNHALSLYLLDSLLLLDPHSPTHALEVLTLTESILESPDLILRKQLDRLKAEKVRELKANGVEYEERMEELEKLEHPKPMRDFIYNTFNEFSRKHPWLGEENIRPKSIAREMFEGFYSFGEYIKEYDLQRAEGLLLRYLSEVYKGLTQNIPDVAKTDEVREIIVYFGTIVRQIDSSLIDEWEKMKNSEASQKGRTGSGHEAQAEEWDRKAFLVMLRNESFRFLKHLALQNYEEALSLLENAAEFSEKAFESAMKTFFEEGHEALLIDAQARGTSHFKLITEADQGAQGRNWLLEQTMTDPDQLNDWLIKLEVDVAKSRAEKRPILLLQSIGPVAN